MGISPSMPQILKRRKYCELYANKFEKLHEIDKILVKQKLQKTTQKETENLTVIFMYL